MDYMKEAIKRKLEGLKEGSHNPGEMKMVAPDADPHPPDMHDHDGDKDNDDYDVLNPGDRAPDLKEKGGDLVMKDHSAPVHDDKGNLHDEDRMANLASILGPDRDSAKGGVVGRSPMNLQERAKAGMKADFLKMKNEK